MNIYLLIASLSLNLIVLFFLGFMLLRQRRLNKHVSIVGAQASEGQLADLIINSFGQVAKLSEEVDHLNQYYGKLYRLTDNTLQNISLVRYDAFEEMGGNLSFSLALLNNQNDGLILTSINGRNDHRLYVKQINAGVSTKYPLTEEESKALTEAQKSARAVAKNLDSTKLGKEVKKKKQQESKIKT